MDPLIKMSHMLLSLQTLSYNRHNLTADTSERQAKEILIRRRHSLRESLRKDNSSTRERRVTIAPRVTGLPRAEPSAVPLPADRKNLWHCWLDGCQGPISLALGTNNKVFLACVEPCSYSPSCLKG